MIGYVLAVETTAAVPSIYETTPFPGIGHYVFSFFTMHSTRAMRLSTRTHSVVLFQISCSDGTCSDTRLHWQLLACSPLA